MQRQDVSRDGVHVCPDVLGPPDPTIEKPQCLRRVPVDIQGKVLLLLPRLLVRRMRKVAPNAAFYGVGKIQCLPFAVSNFLARLHNGPVRGIVDCEFV
jgi:hypothetical protein